MYFLIRKEFADERHMYWLAVCKQKTLSDIIDNARCYIDMLGLEINNYTIIELENYKFIREIDIQKCIMLI